MSGPLLLGLDLGTSGVKAMLISADDGHACAEATLDYPLFTPKPGWSEQKPEDWWRGTTRVIKLVLEIAQADPASIAGMALSGQMHGATLLDARGAVLRPAILWNDQRTAVQTDAITERVGLDNLIRWVGNPALTGFTAPKILWVRDNEPEVYRQIDAALLPKDYVNFMLTGIRATEVSDASGTLLFDVANRRWSQEMLDALHIRAAILPPVYESIDVIGRVTAEAASLTGLKEGTPVVAGGADNACAAVGMGVVSPGQVLTSLGTSGTIVAPSETPARDPLGRLHTFCHAVPNTWYLMGVILSAGGSLRWYRDVIGVPEATIARMQDRDPYETILAGPATIPPGCEGLIFLPYLTGERTPHADPDARGVFFGLSLRHTRAHLARSVIEGVTFALADAAAIMRDLDLDISAVRTTGGGARSALWQQIQADILKSRVRTAHADGGPAFGAALIAGVGVGALPSLQEATERFVTIRSETEPNPDTSSVYARYHRVFDRLYPVLRAEFREAARLLEDGPATE